MDITLIYILVSCAIISVIALVGVVTLLMSKEHLHKIIFILISFAAGTMLGAVFFDLLPESFDQGIISVRLILALTLFGLMVSFLLETFVYLYHHFHKHNCKDEHRKALPLLNLFGDSIHNFIDGTVLGASYLISIPLGIVVTIAVAAHELPQEIGDFGVLIYGGWGRTKALFWNFIVALTIFIGALATYWFASLVSNISAYLIPFAAGGFLYIAAADLLPEIHHEDNKTRIVIQTLLVFFGIALIWALKFFFKIG